MMDAGLQPHETRAAPLTIWLYATDENRVVSHEPDPDVIRSMSIRIALGPLFCIVAAFVSVKHPWIGTLAFLSAPLMYTSPSKVDASWRDAAGED